MIDRISNAIKTNNNYRYVAEAIASFSLMFAINIGLTAGEAGIRGFWVIFDVNLFFAMWISTWVFLAFLWWARTGIGVNLVALTLMLKRKDLDKRTYFTSAGFQFMGAFASALLLWLIIDLGSLGIQEVTGMGGVLPHIKGLFLNSTNPLANADGRLFANPSALAWVSVDVEKHRYLFSAFQGLVCAAAIAIMFIANTFVDNRSQRGPIAKVERYIILVVVIYLASLVSANTTNWVKLMTPAIISQIEYWVNPSLFEAGAIQTTVLYTTMVFVSFQMLGILFIYHLTHLFEHVGKVDTHGDFIGDAK